MLFCVLYGVRLGIEYCAVNIQPGNDQSGNEAHRAEFAAVDQIKHGGKNAERSYDRAPSHGAQVTLHMAASLYMKNRFIPILGSHVFIYAGLYNVICINNRSEPIPYRDKVRTCQVWWSIGDSNP